MKPRILNAVLNKPRRTKPCKAEIIVLEWPDDTYVAFDPNSLCAVQVAKSVATGLKRVTNVGHFDGLLYCEHAPVYQRPRTAPVRKLVLNVSHNCNLACRYCFAAGYTQHPNMPIETAMRALEMIDPKMPVDVAFFGGEPMVAWDVVKAVAERVIEVARNRRVKWGLHMTTNGTLIDKERAEALTRMGFSLLVSLDGPEAIHNENRPAKSGNSFEQTIKGLETLKAAGSRTRIRATFTGDKPELVKRLEFFNRLYLGGLIQGVSIEPAVLSEGCSGSSENEGFDLSNIAREWHAAAEWWVSQVKSGTKALPYFYFQQIGRRILYGRHMGTECGAGRGYLTIGPDGTIYACHREAGTEIGHLDTGFDQVKRMPWWENCLDTHLECRDCWARNICGGGCPQSRVTLGGSISAATPKLCAIRRMIFQECFWILAQLSQVEAQKAIGNGQRRR